MTVAYTDSAAASVAVVAVPFPAQGHLNQMLHLALLLASRGLPVHYAAPAPHVRQARARVHGWDARVLLSLQFHVLDISSYPRPPSDAESRMAFPAHLQPLFDAFCDSAGAPLARLLHELAASHRRVVVVHDSITAFPAAEAARLPNGEAYAFQCLSASFDVGFKDPCDRLVPSLGLPVPPPEAVTTNDFLGTMQRQVELGAPIAGMLHNSCGALEGEFIDAVAESLSRQGKKLFAIGPLNPLLDLKARSLRLQPRHECLDWLDKQPPASVLYVSFGTMTSLPAKQIEELAAALRGSKQRFIWVLRDADSANVFAEAGESRHASLLSQFTKETEGMGLVITGWAPQLEILAHTATAAFISHCGWNSVLESLSHGKPILAWPMHSDQPWDAGYVCNHLKAGIVVRPWEKRGETLPAKAIQAVIQKAMTSDEGLAARRHAEALCQAVRAAVAEGGSSRKDLESFIAHITRDLKAGRHYKCRRSPAPHMTGRNRAVVANRHREPEQRRRHRPPSPPTSSSAASPTSAAHLGRVAAHIGRIAAHLGRVAAHLGRVAAHRGCPPRPRRRPQRPPTSAASLPTSAAHLGHIAAHRRSPSPDPRPSLPSPLRPGRRGTPSAPLITTIAPRRSPLRPRHDRCFSLAASPLQPLHDHNRCSIQEHAGWCPSMDAPAATPPLAEKKKRNRRRSGRGAGGSRILLFLDIASKIMLLSQQCPGAISCYQRMALYPLLPFVSLHLQASLTMQLTRVIFQIVSLSGSYLLADEGEPTGGLNIALSTPCGGIFGGSIGGPLIAAHLVQVVAGSFTCSMKVPKRNEAKSNDDQHTELKVPIWKMQAIRVML